MPSIGDITISTEELKATATKLRTHNDTLDGYLKGIADKVAKLENYWNANGIGEGASDVIRQKMKGMEKHFTDFYEVIKAYAKFLDDAALQYETTETTAKTNASQFR